MLEEKNLPWQEILETLFRRWRVILALTLLGLAVGSVRGVLEAPTYRAAATIMMNPQRGRVMVSPDAGSGMTVERVSDQQINREAAFLKSPALVREVLEQFPLGPEDEEQVDPGTGSRVLAVMAHPLDALNELYRRIHKVPPASRLDKLVASTSRRIEVEAIRRTSLIEVSFRGRDPAWVATFVNELLSHHIDRYARLYEQTAAKRFFEDQRGLLAEKVDAAQAALTSFRERQGVGSLPADDNELRAAVAKLESDRASAETELAEVQARVSFLRQQMLARRGSEKNSPAESRVFQDSSVDVLRSRLVELKVERSEALSRYVPGSTVIQGIDRQIAQLGELLAAEEGTLAEATTISNPSYQTMEVDLVQGEAQIVSLEARLDALSGQIASTRSRLDHLQGVAPDLERLENELTAARDSYRTYLRKEEEARFSSALDESKIVNISIAEPAEIPASPQPANTMRTILFAVIFGLAGGIGLAFVRDWIDPAVKSSAQAQRQTGLEVLAEIPS